MFHRVADNGWVYVKYLTTNFKIKYDTSLAYKIYTLLCAVNLVTMKAFTEQFPNCV